MIASAASTSSLFHRAVVRRAGLCYPNLQTLERVSSGPLRRKQPWRTQCGMEIWVPPSGAGLRIPGGCSLDSFSFSRNAHKLRCACVYICRFDTFYFRLSMCCSLQGRSNQGGREWKTFFVLLMGWQVAFLSSDFPNPANPHLPPRSLKIKLFTVQLANTSWNPQMSWKCGWALCRVCLMLFDWQKATQKRIQRRWNMSPFRDD